MPGRLPSYHMNKRQREQLILDDRGTPPNGNSIRTLGVLEIRALVDQQARSIIIDTGACVSCMDEELVMNHKMVHPVEGVNMKTATDEPVSIVGRTEIILQVGSSVWRFPIFVAKGLGGCCILGNDFHLRFQTTINFGERNVRLVNPGGRVICVPFSCSERDARYLRPLPNPTWLNQIQIEDPAREYARVLSLDTTYIPPGTQKMLKITFQGTLPDTGVMEPMYHLYREKSILMSPCLTLKPPPEAVVVANVSTEMKRIDQGETLAQIYEADLVPDVKVNAIKGSEKSQSQDGFDEAKLKLNPQMTPEQEQKMIELLKEYTDRFSWDPSLIGRTNVSELKIELTDSTPVHQPPYRVSHREREILRQQTEDMLKKDVIRPSSSAYASPVVIVKKKNGEYRFCVDYRRLNERLLPIQHPMPLIDDILTYLNGCQWFATMDLTSGFWQLPVREEDKHITAFVTPDGLWEYEVTPFGLKTSPAAFQNCMDRVLAGLKWGTCLLYLDDILVMAPTYEELLNRLRKVFERLREANLTLNPSKCTFGFREARVLGHIVSADGVSPDPNKVKDILKFEPPRRLRALRSFLGLANYYRKFVPDYSKIARPLIELTKKNVQWQWGEQQHKAFETLKNKLTTAPILRHFDPNLPIELHTDASDVGVGAAVMQTENGETLPVAYASRRLSDAEKKYTVTEKECIGVVWSTQHFRQFLWGRKFTIVVDHHALCWLKKNRDSSGRLARWALKLMEFDYEIKHKQGRLHVVPDMLSRNTCVDCKPEDEDMTNEIPMLVLEASSSHCQNEDTVPLFSLQWSEIQKLQEEDEECKRIKEAVLSPDNATSGDRRLARSFLIENGVLYRRNVAHAGDKRLLYVPKSVRDEILYECHDSPLSGGHLGLTKTFHKLKSRYYWPHMLKDTENYVKTCLHCQTRKTPKGSPAGLLQPIPVGLPFERVGVDVLGPFTKTNGGNRYIIVAMDYATKWAEARATPTATAEETANFLIDRIVCRFGCPNEILTDRGMNFRSNLVRGMLNGLGIRSLFTTAYHPACNGLVEHFNGTLAQMLSFYTGTSQKDWDLYVNLTCFSYNTSRQETTKHSPFYLLFGVEARLPVDVSLRRNADKDNDIETVLRRVQKCRQDVVKLVEKGQKKQKERYDKKHRHVEYEQGEQVMVWTPSRKKGRSTKLLHRWHGPYEIVSKLSDVNYEIKIQAKGGHYIDTVHVGRMKRYYARA